MKTYGDLDSKFRFVILASKRAKELIHGAKTRIKSRSKNPIRIAQEEVRSGAVDYEIIELKKERAREPVNEDFIGEEIVGEIKEIEEEETGARKESKKGKKKKEEVKKEKSKAKGKKTLK